MSSPLANVAQTLTRHARQRPDAIAGLVASHRVALLGPADVDLVLGSSSGSVRKGQLRRQLAGPGDLPGLGFEPEPSTVLVGAS
ncbi:MAG: hypothetical protein ACR2LI_06955 [Propionibacteriaceae bacterium]